LIQALDANLLKIHLLSPCPFALSIAGYQFKKLASFHP
jgi:hypothetical protein